MGMLEGEGVQFERDKVICHISSNLFHSYAISNM